ncbi:MAG: type II secretion system GspH family protein [Ruminococcus sp.]|nr:type II secretion system GspH family protein [Ruminococcus sp.]
MNNIRGKLLKGFTLVELIVVIAIIGILFSVGSLAVSVIIRDANIKTANDSAHEALTYVQNWLIDLEIKNVDIETIFNAHNYNGKDYFQLLSSNSGSAFQTTTGDYAGIKVCLLEGNPYSKTTELKKTTVDPESDDGKKIYDSLKTLSDSFSSSYDGRWRVVVNATDYTVVLAYWQSTDYPAEQITGITGYMFPTKTEGFTAAEQSTQIAGSGLSLMGQYPLAS